MWMYVLVAFFFCTFRRCFFLAVRVHTFRIYLIRYQKADMHKIHTEPDDSAVHFIHASLNRHLSLSIACAPSTSISFGRSFVRSFMVNTVRMPLSQTFDVHFCYCHCCPCIRIHRRAHRTFWIWFQLWLRHRTDKTCIRIDRPDEPSLHNFFLFSISLNF